MPLRYLPNLVTSLRFLLIVPIISAFLEENWHVAFYLFLLAGLSDGIDGLLARCYGWTTHLGAILDPLADKLLLMSSFIALTCLSKMPWWLTSVLVARDLWIMSGTLIYRFWVGSLDYKPIWISKLNTVLQLVFISLLLIHFGFWPLPSLLLHSVSMLMFTTTLISFIQYTYLWGNRVFHAINQSTCSK